MHKKKKKTTNTHLAEDDQRRGLIKLLHSRGPIRRGVSVRIHGQTDGASRIGRVVRERLVLLQSVVQQPVDLVHARPHERSDAGGRDAAEALQRRRQAEKVVRGREEEEEEEGEGGEGEDDHPSSSASYALAGRGGRRGRR